MKKNTFVKILAGSLATALLTGGAVFAGTGSRNIDIYYRNIRLMIDGAEYVPTNANGEVVEPFVSNGTTYLPVRAVANAFGKDVKWDSENSIVYIGKEGRMEPDNRLDNLQYMNYWEEEDSCRLERINGTITDYNGNIYTNGMLIYSGKRSNGVNRYWGDVSFEYPLNGQYERLTGTVVLPKIVSTTTTNKEDCGTSETDVTISDENGNVLFEGKGITASMPFKVDLNVKGLNSIKIYVHTENYDSYVALTDMGLYD